jgi:hypothetical protein
LATNNNKFVVKNGLAVGSSIDVINSSGEWIGATGTLSGATGPQGVQGASGISGASGYVGSDGATGPQGVQGASGSTGLTGATGTQGASGASGVAGIDGATGPGSIWTYIDGATTAQTGGQYVADTSGGSFTLTLPASPSVGYNVAVADGGDWSTNNLTIGRNGSIIEGDSSDLIVDVGQVELKFIYDGTEWQLFSSIGAAGATGVAGASGVGATGPQGVSGATGTQGASGITGASGAAGTSGSTGPQGASGITGASGVAAGAATGATGYVGALYATNQVIIGATSWSSFASPLGATGSLIVAGPMAATNHITTPQLLVGNYGYTGLGATGATGMIIANQLKLVSGGAGSNITFSDGTTLASGTPSGYINGPISGFQLAIGATGNMQPTGATGTAWFGNQIYVGPQGSTGPQWGATGSIRNEGQINTGALHVGTWGATSALGATGEIRATSNITGYYASDKTLKENIREIPDALEKVMKIGGKLYDWTDSYIKAHGGEDAYFLRKSDFGVIAQDVQEVFPVAIRTREDGTLAVDYEKLCALAFAAIKELNNKIENKD